MEGDLTGRVSHIIWVGCTC